MWSISYNNDNVKKIETCVFTIFCSGLFLIIFLKYLKRDYVLKLFAQSMLGFRTLMLVVIGIGSFFCTSVSTARVKGALAICCRTGILSWPNIIF